MGGYNHHYYCDCGWCVKDRGYRYVEKDIKDNFSKIETYESFTIPNIRCKCCGDEIYFYQSPYGGKVFFNELGHPWEKHCCEPKCCAKEKETISYDRLGIRSVTSNKPSWEKNGWTPAIFIKKESYDSYLTKIIVKSMINDREYSFFVQTTLSLDIEESFAINFRILDKNFYEISFYSDRIQRLIANKEPIFNDLKEFLDIENSLKLVKRDNIKNIELAKIFFKFLNTHNNYKDKKEQIYQLIFNHRDSIKSGMLQVYSDVYKQGIDALEENLLNNFELYDTITIHILLVISIEQTLILNRIQKIILDKWNKKGWIPYHYKTNSSCDTSVEKIVLVSVKDDSEHSYYIQKRYFSLALKKGMIVFAKLINEKFFEMLFYDNSSSKECKVIIGKYPSNYELDIFIKDSFMKNDLELIKTKNIENIKLVKIFFRTLNISDVYKSEKKKLFHFVINHESSKQSGMFDIYQYINQFGIKQFEENFFNKFKFYDEKIIDILFSIKNISALDNINEVISKKREENLEKIENKLNIKHKNSNPQKYQQRQNILKDKQVNVNYKEEKNTENLNRNRKKWKGIFSYKSKKELIFIESRYLK